MGLWTAPTLVETEAENSDTTAESVLTARRVALAVVCLLAVSSVSVAYIEPEVGPVVQEEETVETALWMNERAQQHGLTDSESYVFSRWSVNRVYNYFVNGNSRSYAYAQSNYNDFIYDDDPGEWYRTLRDRVGFVVIEPLPRRRGTIQSLLYQTYGSEFRTHDGVSHYRAIYSSDSGKRKVFDLVAGARLIGTTTANTSIQVRIGVDIPNDSFTYRQTVRSDATGNYTATVPYPGRYEIEVGNRTRTVHVPESAVENGTEVRVDG